MASSLHYPLLLAGRPVLRGDRHVLRNPYDESVLAEISYASHSDAAAAFAAASDAFAITKRMAAWQRSEILNSLADRVMEDALELSRTITAEAAKPIADARREVERAVQTLRIAAEEARRIKGRLETADWTPGNEGRLAIERRFPIGPVLGITPFNFPLNLVAHKLAPAIAAGNPIILKPAPQTPLTSLRLGQLAIECGWPEGAISVLPCSNGVAAAMLHDERMAMLSFTGSAAVGWELKAQVPRKRVTLELGGNAAVIVCADADLDLAARRIIAGGFTYAGQSCISVQRVYADAAIHMDLLNHLHKAAESWLPGDPALEETKVGPMISRSAAARVRGWIDQAIACGATVHFGGEVNGAALSPALLSNVPDNCAICSEETFAPVIVVNPYTNLDNAFVAVNRSTYGLQAAVFTRSWPVMARAWNELDVGAVLIDESSAWRAEQLPYGGVKNSGVGKEGLRAAIAEMTEPRLLIVPGNEI